MQGKMWQKTKQHILLTDMQYSISYIFIYLHYSYELQKYTYRYESGCWGYWYCSRRKKW